MTMRLRFERITDARRVPYYSETTTKPMRSIGQTNAIPMQYEDGDKTNRISNEDNTNSMRQYEHNITPGPIQFGNTTKTIPKKHNKANQM